MAIELFSLTELRVESVLLGADVIIFNHVNNVDNVNNNEHGSDFIIIDLLRVHFCGGPAGSRDPGISSRGDCLRCDRRIVHAFP
jgi:hypothetical protein